MLRVFTAPSSPLPSYLQFLSAVPYTMEQCVAAGRLGSALALTSIPTLHHSCLCRQSPLSVGFHHMLLKFLA